MPAEPLLEVTHEQGVTTLQFPRCTHLNDANVDILGEEFRLAAAAAGGGSVVLDLGRIESLSSAVLSRLMWLHREVNTAGGRLTLANVRPRVRDVFKVTKLDQLLDVTPA